MSKVIPMLRRNVTIKEAPEDFRKMTDSTLRSIDVIVCSEYDIFDRVVSGECVCSLVCSLIRCSSCCCC